VAAARGKRRGADAGEGADPAAEAAELVRFFLRKTAGGKERLVAVLDRHVKVVRTEHCFLLFEELGRRDGWVQCLEVSREHILFPVSTRSIRSKSQFVDSLTYHFSDEIHLGNIAVILNQITYLA
jgi:hypothetical protein